MNAHQAPQRFGRYVLLDRMGAGGMAEVFRAVVPGAEGFRRDLVVKRILGDRARAANFIEMFVHEARISALLHHPNVVQVFDFGQVDGSYFLAMELLRGRDLLAVLRSLSERQRPFPIPVAIHIAHQVALGLGYAHGLTSPDGQPLNIIHRDVSPSNIMLLRTGGVKLLDFGIAQAIGEMDSEENARNSFKGKVSYMAPERLRGEPVDGRADLFALGAVLWEMLAGRRLFHGKTDGDKLRRVLDKPIPPPSSVRPDVSPELDRIVLKALARDRDERYQTGQSLADDLEDLVAQTRYHSRMLPALLNELFGSAPSSAHLALSNAPADLFAFEPITTPAGTAALSRTDTPAPEAGQSVVTTALPQGDSQLTELEKFSSAARLARRVRGFSKGMKVALAAGLVASLGVAAAVALTRPIGAGTGVTMGTSTSAPAGAGHAGEARAANVIVPLVATGTGDSSARAGEAARVGAELAEPPVAAVSPEASARAAALKEQPAGHAGAVTAVASPQARGIHPRAIARAPDRMRSGRITRGLSIDPFAEAATRESKR